MTKFSNSADAGSDVFKRQFYGAFKSRDLNEPIRIPDLSKIGFLNMLR